ncbi:MAG: 4a-hydroxytetrahydrobiopterin dehydratase [bacterium]|nr:4a-hydroxytetrahydrobiopterin dehydratase [bacterium]MDZ4296308.1 4a-hydroxytetrahydrobiopterin dehydratase [Patescibacteria group bacterium]
MCSVRGWRGATERSGASSVVTLLRRRHHCVLALDSYVRQLKTSWTVLDETKIRREFTFRDFPEAMAFVNKVAQLAESENHHPDMHIFYSRVVIELWTHAIGGLSENDFIVAAKIEELVAGASIP